MDGWSLLNEVDILPKLPKDFNELVESKKWMERRDALQAVFDEITKNPRLSTTANYNEIVEQLRNVLSKDANINVCALAAKCITGLANGLHTKFAPYASAFVSIIFERFKEKKPTLRDPLIDCIDVVTTTINLESVTEELISSIDKPNPNIKLQGCNFFYRIMKRYSTGTAPKKLIKVVAPFLTKLILDPDSDVRDAACCALGSIMRLTGEDIMRTFIGSVKEDKTKWKKITDAKNQAKAELTEEVIKKSDVVRDDSAPVTNRSLVSDDATVSSNEAAEFDVWDALAPVDVISKLPATFTDEVESKKWTERRDALTALVTLCNNNPRLCPKASYGEHVALLKKVLEKDSNINVCACAARCITALANGLRQKFAMHVSLIAPVIFDKFKEKKPTLRDPLIDCIDAVAASTTIEAMLDDILAALEKQNPNIKIQTNLFLYRVFKKHNQQSTLKKAVKALVPLVIKQTCDSDPEVRDASYAALGAVMKAIGDKACTTLFTDIVGDKMKMAKIKEFYEKAKQEAGADVVSVMVQSIHKSNSNALNSNAEKGIVEDAERPLKPPAPGVGSKQFNSQPSGTRRSDDHSKANESTSNVVNGDLNENYDDEPPRKKEELLQLNKEKAIRLRDEKNLKLLKWNFDQPTAEHIEQLRTLLSSVAQPSLLIMLFHKDFKQHLRALELLQTAAVESSGTILANCDLILKWISLRFFETNPTVLLKTLELTETVFMLIMQFEEPFSDAEMNSFLPHLILKLGESKEAVRTPVRSILHIMKEIVGSSKLFPGIMDGLKTKNSRQRTECLQFIEQLIDYAGLAGMPNPGATMKMIASCIGDRDNNVRSAGINAVVAAWKEEGDRIYTLVGKMSDKERVLLEERIKRCGAVPKSKGAVKVGVPERDPKQSRGRPSIATGIKGRAVSVARSCDSGASSHNPTSADYSPERPLCDKTFTMQKGEGRESQTSGSARRFKLDPTLFAINDLNRDDVGVVYPDDLNKLDILEPVEPYVRKRVQSHNVNARAESVSSITSLESSASEVEKVVHGIASVSQATACAAISQLQFLFGDVNTFHFVADRVDSVIQAIVVQMSLVRSRQLDDVSALNDVNELVRAICHFLSSLVKEPLTCSRISADALKMLIQEFLYLLKDERMVQLKDSESIFRSLNYLSIRICNNADATSCFLALTSMLTSALKDPRNKTIDLINKCIYKQSELFLREVPIDLSIVIKVIHVFMEEFRSKVDTNESVKCSMHSIELCIQRLVAGTMSGVVNSINLIPNPESSEAVKYMNKCVRSFKSNPSSMTSSMNCELPGQVLTSNVEESMLHLVNEIVIDPLGTGLRRLHTYIKMNPDGRKYLDDSLRKHEKLKEFIIYHLKRMEHGENDKPDVSQELKVAIDYLKSVRNELTICRSGNNRGAGDVGFENDLTIAANSLQNITLTEAAVPEVAPRENGVKPARRNIRASDVEALKQHLSKIRGQS